MIRQSVSGALGDGQVHRHVPTPREYAANAPGFFAALRKRDPNFAVRPVRGARPMTLPDERHRAPVAAALTPRPTTGGHRGNVAVLPRAKALAVAREAGLRRRQSPKERHLDWRSLFG
jgi:hypothetical protein